MSIVDERVSQLLSEIHNKPSPEEAFSKWMFIDIFILDGLMMLFVILFLIVRDIYLVSMVGAFSIAFGAVYLHVKDGRKHAIISGRDFLDSQTIVGDIELSEQIPVLSYDYVLLPERTLTGKMISYNRVDINDSLGTLRTVPMRVGGSSALRPEAVDNLVRLRLRELKEIEDLRKKGRKRDKKKKKEVETSEKEEGFFARRRARRVKEIPKVRSDEGYNIGDIDKNLQEEAAKILDEDAVPKDLSPEKKKILEEYDGIEIDDILFDIDEDFGGDD
jgi:hypothetical protein